MLLSFTTNNIHFKLQLEEAKNYRPATLHHAPDKQEQKEIKAGNLAFYDLIVIGTLETEELTHYFSGILLSTKEDERVEDLEFYLDENGALDKILKAWEKLKKAQNRPEWA